MLQVQLLFLLPNDFSYKKNKIMLRVRARDEKCSGHLFADIAMHVINQTYTRQQSFTCGFNGPEDFSPTKIFFNMTVLHCNGKF